MKDDDLEATINYAHSIGKKIYVTLNIFAWDEKYEEIIEMSKKLEKLKPDGVIVADGGVMEIIKRICSKCANKCKYTGQHCESSCGKLLEEKWGQKGNFGKRIE